MYPSYILIGIFIIFFLCLFIYYIQYKRNKSTHNKNIKRNVIGSLNVEKINNKYFFDNKKISLVTISILQFIYHTPLKNHLKENSILKNIFKDIDRGEEYIDCSEYFNITSHFSEPIYLLYHHFQYINLKEFDYSYINYKICTNCDSYKSLKLLGIRQIYTYENQNDLDNIKINKNIMLPRICNCNYIETDQKYISFEKFFITSFNFKLKKFYKFLNKNVQIVAFIIKKNDEFKTYFLLNDRYVHYENKRLVEFDENDFINVVLALYKQNK